MDLNYWRKKIRNDDHMCYLQPSEVAADLRVQKVTTNDK